MEMHGYKPQDLEETFLFHFNKLMYPGVPSVTTHAGIFTAVYGIFVFGCCIISKCASSYDPRR